MTRIISGVAGSRLLKAPAKGTRPTSDRVREAVFSALEARDLIFRARVLDLYAGTGALGLEAISRGALQAVLVESNRQAAQVCRHNSDLVLSAFSAEKPTIRIVEKPVTSFLAANRDVFDLVLIDPPYGVENLELETLFDLLELGLADQAMIILERATKTEAPQLPEKFELVGTKIYGDTAIHWIEFNRQH